MPAEANGFNYWEKGSYLLEEKDLPAGRKEVTCGKKGGYLQEERDLPAGKYDLCREGARIILLGHVSLVAGQRFRDASRKGFALCGSVRTFL